VILLLHRGTQADVAGHADVPDFSVSTSGSTLAGSSQMRAGATRETILAEVPPIHA